MTSAAARRRKRKKKAASPSRTEGNVLLRQWCAPLTGFVLSVGSGDDRDREGGRYRDYFTSAAGYFTSDVRPGCDFELDVRDLSGVVETYEAVFAHSVFEHVDDVFAAARECARIVRPGGVLILGVPFRYRIHRAPLDFWRFTEFGVRYLLTRNGLAVEEIVGVDGPAKHPAFYWARARKPQ